MDADADANANADAGGSTIALHERCSGKLKIRPKSKFGPKLISHKYPMYFGFPSKIRDLSPCTVQRILSQDYQVENAFPHLMSDPH